MGYGSSTEARLESDDGSKAKGIESGSSGAGLKEDDNSPRTGVALDNTAVVADTGLKEDDNFPRTGVSLDTLKRFMERHETVIGDMPTCDVCEQVVKTQTKEAGCSYVSLLHSQGETVGRATVFVSHAWKYKFRLLVEALLSLQATEAHPEEVFVWIDVFSVNQHLSHERDFAWWSSTFKESVRSIGHTLLVLMPYADPIPLTRAWCLFEIFCTVDTGAKLDIRLPAEEGKAFAEALRSGNFDFNKWVTGINLRRAEAWDKRDLEMITKVVEESVGVAELNVLVLEGLRGWVVTEGKKGLEESRAKGEDTLGSLNNLANLLSDQGKLGEAEPLYREALEGMRAKLGADHPDTLFSLTNLAMLLANQGKLGEAELLYQEALEGMRAKLGADHPNERE